MTTTAHVVSRSGDYRPRSNYFPLYIGVGATSPEATSDLSYLCRAAPDAPPPAPRQSFVGEVGWGWQYNQLLNGDRLLSNMQIKETQIEKYIVCKTDVAKQWDMSLKIKKKLWENKIMIL
uniref:Chromosome 23 C4orf45 homolog n=1 Tax=Xiphophorus maculatus TaxID=8083 RepID=A0A3B5QC49_XIPMA